MKSTLKTYLNETAKFVVMMVALFGFVAYLYK